METQQSDEIIYHQLSSSVTSSGTTPRRPTSSGSRPTSGSSRGRQQQQKTGNKKPQLPSPRSERSGSVGSNTNTILPPPPPPAGTGTNAAIPPALNLSMDPNDAVAVDFPSLSARSNETNKMVDSNLATPSQQEVKMPAAAVQQTAANDNGSAKTTTVEANKSPETVDEVSDGAEPPEGEKPNKTSSPLDGRTVKKLFDAFLSGVHAEAAGETGGNTTEGSSSSVLEQMKASAREAQDVGTEQYAEQEAEAVLRSALRDTLITLFSEYDIVPKNRRVVNNPQQTPTPSTAHHEPVAGTIGERRDSQTETLATANLASASEETQIGEQGGVTWTASSNENVVLDGTQDPVSPPPPAGRRSITGSTRTNSGSPAMASRGSSPPRRVAPTMAKSVQTDAVFFSEVALAASQSSEYHQDHPPFQQYPQHPVRDPRIANVIAGAAGKSMAAEQEFVVEDRKNVGKRQLFHGRFYPSANQEYFENAVNEDDAHRPMTSGKQRPISASLQKMVVSNVDMYQSQELGQSSATIATHDDGGGSYSEEGGSNMTLRKSAENVFKSVHQAITNEETGRSIFEEGDYGVEWHENDTAKVDRRQKARDVQRKDYELLHNLSRERRDYIMYRSSDPARKEASKQNAIALEMERFARQSRGTQRIKSSLRQKRQQQLAEASALEQAARGDEFSGLNNVSEFSRDANEVIHHMDSVLVRCDEGNPFTGKQWEGSKNGATAFNPVLRPSSAQVNPSLKVSSKGEGSVEQRLVHSNRIGSAGSAAKPSPGGSAASRTSATAVKSLHIASEPTPTPVSTVAFSSYVAKQRAANGGATTRQKLEEQLDDEVVHEQNIEKKTLKQGTNLSWVSTSVTPQGAQARTASASRYRPKPSANKVA